MFPYFNSVESVFQILVILLEHLNSMICCGSRLVHSGVNGSVVNNSGVCVQVIRKVKPSGTSWLRCLSYFWWQPLLQLSQLMKTLLWSQGRVTCPRRLVDWTVLTRALTAVIYSPIYLVASLSRLQTVLQQVKIVLVNYIKRLQYIYLNSSENKEK